MRSRLSCRRSNSPDVEFERKDDTNLWEDEAFKDRVRRGDLRVKNKSSGMVQN